MNNIIAIKFLESVSRVEDIDGDNLESVSMYDAVHAVKLAELEILNKIYHYVNGDHLNNEILSYLEKNISQLNNHTHA